VVVVIIIVVLVVVFIIGSFVFYLLKGKLILEGIEKALSSLHDFSASQKIMSFDFKSGLAVDEQRKKVCLISVKKQVVKVRVISHSDLVSCELFEDGTTITKTVRSSQIVGALIGGVVAGGVGAIIGGLSGKTATAGKVKRIDLRLIVNDTKNPLHDINFINLTNSELSKDSPAYQKIMQEARHWHGLIEVLIKKADSEDRARTSQEMPAMPPRSIADELKKFVDLRQSGVLSPDEFQQQKLKLLGQRRKLRRRKA
jgi:hypothetical protein